MNQGLDYKCTAQICENQEATSIFSKEGSTTHSSQGQPLFPNQEYYKDENLSDNNSYKCQERQEIYGSYQQSLPFYCQKGNKSQSQETRNSSSFSSDILHTQKQLKKQADPIINNYLINQRAEKMNIASKYQGYNSPYTHQQQQIPQSKNRQSSENQYLNTQLNMQSPPFQKPQKMQHQSSQKNDYSYGYPNQAPPSQNFLQDTGIHGQQKAPEILEKYQIEQFKLKYELTDVNLFAGTFMFEKGARFFVIKSFNEDNIFKALVYKLWQSTKDGNDKLSQVYKHSLQNGSYPIFLFFSSNQSGQFCGVAQMISDIDSTNNFVQWTQQKTQIGNFSLKWIFVKDIQNKHFKHLQNTLNDNSNVAKSRDSQEVSYYEGLGMLEIFRDFAEETSIFNDFENFEKTERKSTKKQKKTNSTKSFKPPLSQKFDKIYPQHPTVMPPYQQAHMIQNSDYQLQRAEEQHHSIFSKPLFSSPQPSYYINHPLPLYSKGSAYDQSSQSIFSTNQYYQ